MWVSLLPGHTEEPANDLFSSLSQVPALPTELPTSHTPLTGLQSSI